MHVLHMLPLKMEISFILFFWDTGSLMEQPICQQIRFHLMIDRPQL